MNTLNILFETSRFNLSKVGERFINPCCLGEDLASWLRTELANKHVEAAQPYQEDWGWELPVTHANDAYYLCMSGNPDDSGTSKDDGEWRVIVQKRQSIWQRLTGKGKSRPMTRWCALLKELCPVNLASGTSGVE